MNLKQLFQKNKSISVNQPDIFPVAGLGILMLFVLRLFIDTGSEEGDWLQYFSVGILFPLLLIGFLKMERFAFNYSLKVLLAFFFIAYSGWIYFNFYVSLLVIAAITLLLILNAKRAKGELEQLPGFDLNDAALFAVSGLFAAKLYWWRDSYDFISFYPLFVLFTSLTLIYFAFFRPNFFAEVILKSTSLFNSPYLHYAIALILFTLASFRYYSLDWDSIHHWGVYVGPAQLVRQGGWLLWSVPSQYGFLSILSISILPFESCWQSFYFLNGFLLLATAFIIFYIFYSRKPGFINFFFSLLVTFASLFLFIGWVPTLHGSFALPSVGPYRFFWLYLMLFFLFILTKKDSNSYWNRNKLKVGALIWLCGVIWSFESAFYVSSIWFSYLFVDAMAITGDFSYEKLHILIKKFLSKLFFSVACFAGFLLLLLIYYKIRLGNSPDLVCFYEPALSFMGGFGGIVIDGSGSVGMVLFILFLFAAIVADKFKKFSENKKEAALLVAAWFGLWSSLSYFSGRSHENNISNLMPLISVATAILIYSVQADRFKRQVNIALIPFYSMIFYLTYGNLPALSNYFPELSNVYSSDIDASLAQTDPLLLSVFEKIGLQENDSVVYFDDVMLLNEKKNQIKLQHYYWLPVNPVTVMNPLKKERAYIYLERFIKQFHSGGWMIRKKSSFDQYMLDFSVIEKIISNYYNALPGGYEDNNWKITKYKIKSKAVIPASLVQSVNDLLNKSVTAYNQSRFEECVELCKRVLLIEPNNVMAYNNICSAYNSLHKYEEAMAACEKALTINPNFEIAKNNLRESVNALHTPKHE